MKKPRLLIVEKCKLTSNILKQIATSCGYDAIAVHSFLDAKASFHQNRKIDIVITNHNVDDSISGQVTDYFIKHTIPVIVFTEKASIQTQTEIMQYEIIDFISNENTQAFLYLRRLLISQISNKDITILIVDDSSTSLRHMNKLLVRRNFNVLQAKNGRVALDILNKNPNVKIIITDHEMPKMSGVELTHRIRDKYSKGTKNIIGVSGLNENHIQSSRFLKNGADDFIRKPYSDSEFYCRVMQSIEMLNYIDLEKKAANTDFLTGLPNRRCFFEKINSAEYKNKIENENHAIAILDIDHFKQINDTYGHETGDVALKEFSAIINYFFALDLNARVGGEEFAILLFGKNKTDIKERLDTFRIAVENNKFHADDKVVNFTVSIGASYNSNSDIDSKLNIADEALYESKENGRNKVTFH
jgi:diguanylate cyclase (GGDEF)-like protein